VAVTQRRLAPWRNGVDWIVHQAGSGGGGGADAGALGKQRKGLLRWSRGSQGYAGVCTHTGAVGVTMICIQVGERLYVNVDVNVRGEKPVGLHVGLLQVWGRRFSTTGVPQFQCPGPDDRTCFLMPCVCRMPTIIEIHMRNSLRGAVFDQL
jgi:hypothetical protein